jgi:MFS superfamily sulfate permease-like transporter
MNSNSDFSFLKNLKNDLPASLVVFLVAVPLCLGIALASLPPDYIGPFLFSGVIAGIIGGIIVGSISGSPLGVSGPAAGLAVIVFSAIEDLGSFESFLLAVFIAGILQILLGLIKAGVIGLYFPSSVIKGMLAGIGIIIIKKEVPYALGSSDTTTFTGMFDSLSSGATLITIVSLAILILWEQPFMKKINIFKIVQGPLVVVLTGIGLGAYFAFHETLALGEGTFVKIPVLASFSEMKNLITFPDFSQFGNAQIYIVAVTIAIVASLETLLCVEATDKLDPHKRVTPTNRELVAQGAGNMVSGLIGGLPITQVIVRSSANLQSGGQTKMSAILHGFLLLFCALLIPSYLNMVPLASLAAILFVVGYKLAKPSLFADMFSKGMQMFIPFVVTIGGIVFTDLLVGIGLGMVVAIAMSKWTNFTKPFTVNENENNVSIRLSENVTFASKAAIQKALNEVSPNSTLTVDGSATKSVHPDVVEIVNDFKTKASENGIEFKVVNL